MENLPQTDRLAQQIQRHHDDAQRCAGEAVKHASLAGEALLKAKAEIGHGKFQAWFHDAGFVFAERTAQAYMRLAKEWPKLPQQKRNAVADLSLRDAMKALAKPIKGGKPAQAVKATAKPKRDPAKVYDNAAALLPDMDRKGLADLAFRCIDLIARGGDEGAYGELCRLNDRATEKMLPIRDALSAKPVKKKAARKAKPTRATMVRGTDAETGQPVIGINMPGVFS